MLFRHGLNLLKANTRIRAVCLIPGTRDFIYAGARGGQSADILAYRIPESPKTSSPVRLGQLRMSRQHTYPPAGLSISPDGSLLVISNSTNGDPGFGVAGFNQVNMPDTATVGVAGWFNSNPPNLQGRVGPAGTMLLGQFALSNTAFMTLFMKVGYNSGIAGAPVQFGEGTFNLGVPAPGAIALLGLAGLTGRRRR